MPRVTAGCLAVTHGLTLPEANNRIVEVVKRVLPGEAYQHSQAGTIRLWPGEDSATWLVRCATKIPAELNFGEGWQVVWGFERAVREKHLTPISGPDIDVGDVTDMPIATPKEHLEPA